MAYDSPTVPLRTKVTHLANQTHVGSQLRREVGLSCQPLMRNSQRQNRLGKIILSRRVHVGGVTWVGDAAKLVCGRY